MTTRKLKNSGISQKVSNLLCFDIVCGSFTKNTKTIKETWQTAQLPNITEPLHQPQ